jgi:hypothetical protein
MNLKYILQVITLLYFLFLTAFNASGLVGTSSFEVVGGNSTNPTYYIASVPISEDTVYAGTVASTDDSNAYILFDSETNASGVVSYPFLGNNVFVPGVQIPKMTAWVDSNGIIDSNITAIYENHTFVSSKDKFTPGHPPEVILYDADYDESAVVVAGINSSGQLNDLNVTTAGSGYLSNPKVKVIAGAHFVKITDTNNPYNGRVFLIKDNNKTRLNLDLSRLGTGEPTNVSSYFPSGTQIEIIPAATLGSLFGKLLSELPSNWSSGLPSASDWIYIWDVLYGGYKPYFFLGTSHESYNYGQGWYSKDSTSAGILNHTVIYPDEAFIIAKRTAGDVTFEFEGQIETSDKKLLLPESGNQILAKNPYGADLMISELIPSTAITTHDGNASLFRAMETSSDEGDIITLLNGNVWEQFYYDESHGNTGITKSHGLGTRRPLDGSDNNLTGTFPMDGNDFLIDDDSSNTVSNIASSDSTGQTDQNDTSYSKIYLNHASRSNIKGFTITFEGIQGYLLAEDGLNELNATTENQVTSVSAFSELSSSATRGSIIDSKLNGSFEIIKSGSDGGGTFVVINKQRDINFKSNEGSPIWRIGIKGVGYSTNANFYCIGGNNGTTDSNATGTISTTGGVTVSSGGAGYQFYSPDAIVSGGGWRKLNSAGSKDNKILGASSGLLLQRNSLSGTKSYIESLNPFE